MLGSASSSNCPSPPQGFDALRASPTQIAYYGLPPRPTDPAALAKWETVVTHAKHRACGTGEPGDPVPANPTAQQRQAPAWVLFAASTSYAAALRATTDLGLELSGPPCPTGIANGTPWSAWQPMGVASGFAQQPQMTVRPTPLAPSDWLARLQTTPHVATVRTDLVWHCPAILSRTPPPGTLLTLGPHPPATYARLSFAAGTSYDEAVQAINALGLRLASPCYEHAEHATAAGTSPLWQPAGQEASFAATRMLVVAPGPDAATTWQAQARDLAGVSAVTAPYAPTCG